NRSAPSLAGRFRAQGGLVVYGDLLKGDALALQPTLGPHARGAPGGGIDHDLGHAYLPTRSLSPRRLDVPADRSTAVKPAFLSSRQAAPECWPMASTTMIVLALYFSSSPSRLTSFSWGMFNESTIWPASNSFLARTSKTTPSSRLTSAVSSRVARLLPPFCISVIASRTSRARKILTSTKLLEANSIRLATIYKVPGG